MTITAPPPDGTRGVEARTAAPEVDALDVVRHLCAALHAARIRYCHWKSTATIHRSATGENDLDLLIAPDDVGRFESVLRSQGWKEVMADGWAQMPGIRHFYGFDVGSDRLVDVHAHERLVIGDDATKNYQLPIEEAYVSSATLDEVFMVPSPAFEYVLLVVRLMLKHRSPEAAVTGRGSLSSAEREELRHLAARITHRQVRNVLREGISFLDEHLLDLCVRALEPGCPVAVRIDAWRGLRRRLAPYAKRGRAADAWLQTWRRLGRRFRARVLGRPGRRRLAEGQCVVAIVGSDGAGKSTLVDELARWLSAISSTSTLHLGKPRRSVYWLALRGFLRFGRAIGLRPSSRAVGTTPTGDPNTWSYAWILTGAINARDRSRDAARARRLAARGTIVICDRYPIPSVTEIDGPRVDESHASTMTGLRRRLVYLERRPYGRIQAPDIVVVLQVDPDVAIGRRPEADPALVRSRAGQIRSARWPANALVVDADGAPDHVLRDVKARLWPRL